MAQLLVLGPVHFQSCSSVSTHSFSRSLTAHVQSTENVNQKEEFMAETWIVSEIRDNMQLKSRGGSSPPTPMNSMEAPPSPPYPHELHERRGGRRRRKKKKWREEKGGGRIS